MNYAALRSAKISCPGEIMATIEELRNALSFLVGIIEHTGELRGRVRLHKIGYLLQQRGFAPLAQLDFSYHHYGPYSDQLAGVLEQATFSELVHEVEQRSETGHRNYVYRPNREHPDLQYLQLDDADRAELRKVADVTRWAKWRTLELAATVIYLERNLELSRAAAMERALLQKPQCVDFRAQAEELLAKLGF